MSHWTCNNCGLRFFAVDNPLPRVEQCPRCGEAVLLSKVKETDNDESSFWLGFLFGWWGVLFSGATKGKSGINHALGGSFVAWLAGIVLMALFFLVVLILLWLKF